MKDIRLGTDLLTRLILLAVSGLLLSTGAQAQPDAESVVRVIERASPKVGVGAIDSLRLNLSVDIDSSRAALYLMGQSTVESPTGSSRAARSIVRFHLNMPVRSLPDGLEGRVTDCPPEVRYFGGSTISDAEGAFAIAIPVPLDRLNEALGCLAISASTSWGHDAVGAVAHLVVD